MLSKHKYFWIYLIAILLGLFSGFSEIHGLQALGALISDIFIRIFKCISLPIITLSIIVTLATYTAEAGMQKIWRHTIFFTLSTTFIAATISCILYLLIKPSNVYGLVDKPPLTEKALSYFQHVANLIPANLFSPFIEHQVMGALLVGILIGLAIRQIPDPISRQMITHFFKGAHGILMVITRWVVTIIPLGLYGFITTTILQLRHGLDIKGIGKYLIVIVSANLIQGFIILPLWLRVNGLRPFITMKKMLPALSMAFFSKSSAGSLPITIATAEKNLSISPRIAQLVLPLCTSLNMNGCAAFIFATVVYLMQNHGIEMSLVSMVLWIFIATVTAIGNAGVPMGCFFLSASLLASMNVPISLLGLILPFYSMIDMLETALNVWSDACVTSVIQQKMLLDETGRKSDIVESPTIQPQVN